MRYSFEGSAIQNGTALLLISLPADFTTRIHSATKIMIPSDLASGPESGGTAVAIPGGEDVYY